MSEHIYSRCRKCGKILKDKKYKKIGYGKCCLEQIRKENKEKNSITRIFKI